MEFMQFHPTGMVWPPSVRGTLITEGVRGEGGTLRNSAGKRIMFDYIPELYANETADTEVEADQWLRESTSGASCTARRTPDLLPRDIVARAIHSEVKAGRGSPHGGVFLDIHSRRSAEDIKRKLPAMYHQFKELGDIDITKESDGGRADGSLHDGRHSGRPRDARVAHQGPLRGGRVRRRHARRQSPGR